MDRFTAVCPFLSSTFVDFKEEREHLVKKIFPTLNQLCQERGTYFSPVDLRWGITDEQAEKGEVIRMCLDYIEQSAPFFMCMIGDRYGTHRPSNCVPLPNSLEQLPTDASWLDRSFVVASQKGHQWVLNGDYPSCSVTELEVQKAAFIDKLPHCYFYIRDSALSGNECQDDRESTTEQARLENLKIQILSSHYTVHYFKSVEELGEMVLKDWTEVINDIFAKSEGRIEGKKTPEEQQEYIAQKLYADSKRRAFIDSPITKDIAEELCNFANVINLPSERWDEKNILILGGKHGSGKSALLSAWVSGFTETCRAPVFVHHIGASGSSSDIANFLKTITEEMRSRFIGKTVAGGDNFQEIVQSFKGSLELGTSVIVLDGIEKMGRSMECSEKQMHELAWLPNVIPKSCRLIISCNESSAIYETLLQRKDCTAVRLPPMDSLDIKCNVVKEHLSLHHKSLTERQLKTIANANLSAMPLYLTTVVNELRLFGDFEQLDTYIEQYASVGSLKELWRMIITRWIREYGYNKDNADNNTRTWYGWVIDCLCFITCSRHGLCPSEIVEILNYIGYGCTDGFPVVTSYDWALLRYAAGDVIVERNDGVVVIADDDLGEVIEEFLTDNTWYRFQRSFYHSRISAYLWELPHSLRRSLELPWQLRQHEEVQHLKFTLCEPQVFMDLYDLKFDHSRRIDVVGYWEYLKSEGVDPSTTYWQLIQSLSPIVISQITPGPTQKTDVCDDMPYWLLKFKDPIEMCRFTAAVGQFLAETGQFQGAEKILKLSYTILDEKCLCIRVPEQMLLCEIQQAIAELYYYQLHKNDAAIWYENCLTTVNRVIGKLESRKKYKELPTNYEIKGKVLDRLGNMKMHDFAYQLAEELLLEAKDCMKQAGSELGIARVDHHLAIVMMRNDNQKEAEKLLLECAVVLQKWFGTSHPKVADILNDLADLKADSRTLSYNRKEALRIYSKTLKIRRDSLGNNHLLVATTLYHIGKVLVNSRDESERKEGVEKIREAFSIRSEILGIDHPITDAVRKYLDKIENKRKNIVNLSPEIGRRKKLTPSETSMWWRENKLGSDQFISRDKGCSSYNSFDTLDKRNKRRDEHWTSGLKTLSKKKYNYYYYIDDFYTRNCDEFGQIADEVSQKTVLPLKSCNQASYCDWYIGISDFSQIDQGFDIVQSFSMLGIDQEGKLNDYKSTSVNAVDDVIQYKQLDAVADGKYVLEFDFTSGWEQSQRILDELH